MCLHAIAYKCKIAMLFCYVCSGLRRQLTSSNAHVPHRLLEKRSHDIALDHFPFADASSTGTFRPLMMCLVALHSAPAVVTHRESERESESSNSLQDGMRRSSRIVQARRDVKVAQERYQNVLQIAASHVVRDSSSDELPTITFFKYFHAIRKLHTLSQHQAQEVLLGATPAGVEDDLSHAADRLEQYVGHLRCLKDSSKSVDAVVYPAHVQGLEQADRTPTVAHTSDEEHATEKQTADATFEFEANADIEDRATAYLTLCKQARAAEAADSNSGVPLLLEFADNFFSPSAVLDYKGLKKFRYQGKEGFAEFWDWQVRQKRQPTISSISRVADNQVMINATTFGVTPLSISTVFTFDEQRQITHLKVSGTMRR
jgi:hypothetical protein